MQRSGATLGVLEGRVSHWNEAVDSLALDPSAPIEPPRFFSQREASDQCARLLPRSPHREAAEGDPRSISDTRRHDLLALTPDSPLVRVE